MTTNKQRRYCQKLFGWIRKRINIFSNLSSPYPVYIYGVVALLSSTVLEGGPSRFLIKWKSQRSPPSSPLEAVSCSLWSTWPACTYGSPRRTGLFSFNLIKLILKLPFIKFSFRNHPEVIKKRFLSVGFMMLLSPLFPWIISSREFNEKVPLWFAMGFRLKGFLTAFILPLLLTMLLFLGPISVKAVTGTWQRYLGEW